MPAASWPITCAASRSRYREPCRETRQVAPSARALIRPHRRTLIWTVAIALWLGSAGTGLLWLMAYDNTPGAGADAPDRWPASTALTRDPETPTLVMLAHPRCDCTRAS